MLAKSSTSWSVWWTMRRRRMTKQRSRSLCVFMSLVELTGNSWDWDGEERTNKKTLVHLLLCKTLIYVLKHSSSTSALLSLRRSKGPQNSHESNLSNLYPNQLKLPNMFFGISLYLNNTLKSGRRKWSKLWK